MTSRSQTVSLLVLLCCSGLGLVTSTLTVLPLNDAVLVGSTVELSCATSSSASRVMWIEFASTSGGSVISDGKIIVPSHPSASRFSIVGGALDYNLQIRNVSLADAGTYQCQDIYSGPPNTFSGYAELVVLDGNPVCQDFDTYLGEVLEGSSYSSECKIGYKGNIVPIMEWAGPGNFAINGSTTPEFVRSWKRFTADRSVNGGVFTCHTRFPQIVPSGPGHANNSPTYEHTYNSAVLQVKWGPKQMFITPSQFDYAVGDVLTCIADASPAPFYQWQNMRTMAIHTGQTFTVTQDLLGFNQTMRCQAQNLINGFIHSGNVFQSVYVPAPTSPPTKPVTSPTTTKPALCPCDDMTGQWLSQDPNAELILEVIRDSEIGEIRGIVKNMTDTISVEVIGTARRGDFLHIPLTAIWPFQDGTTSMAGIRLRKRT